MLRGVETACSSAFFIVQRCNVRYVLCRQQVEECLGRVAAHRGGEAVASKHRARFIEPVFERGALGLLAGEGLQTQTERLISALPGHVQHDFASARASFACQSTREALVSLVLPDVARARRIGGATGRRLGAVGHDLCLPTRCFKSEC